MQLTWACPRSVWTHVVDRSPQATFFHTPAWADVVRARGLGEPCALLARWPDGRMALCVLAVRPAWRGLVRAARCGLAGGYGGLVASGPLGEAEQREVYRALRERFRACSGLTNPFSGPPPDGTGFTLQPSAPAQAIRLAPLTELRRRYHPDVLAAVATYRQAGVGLRLIERPCPDDWAVFRQLHDRQGAMRQQGCQEAAWFACLQRYGGRALKMLQATVDGQPAGMLVVAIQGRIATELHLAWDRRFACQQVTTALREGCLDACHARGLIWLDGTSAGGPDTSVPGLTGFGSETLPIWAFEQTSWPIRGLRLRQAPAPLEAIAS